jgi:O-antigen ligase
MIEDKPVLGFGPGTYQFFYGNYQVRKDMTHISTYSGSKGHAHSEYLNYLSETGLPGLIIFVSLLLSAFYTAVKLIYRLPNGFEKDMTYCLLLGLITFIIHGFFNGFIEFDKLAMPVFVAMAGITALAIRETDLNRSYEVRS